MGNLTYSRELNTYSTCWPWLDGFIVVSFCVEGPDDPDFAAKASVACNILAADQDWQARLVTFALSNFLELAQEWGTGLDPVNPEEFKSRINIKEIQLTNENEFEAWFDDGGVFAGHWISIQCSVSGGPVSADLVG
ncbi:MAG: DUF2262 domain-containing protein [Proteobacteria bacterium]|nr:DUF2262 domain-containing protein [Pseudomonadota bacterium]